MGQTRGGGGAWVPGDLRRWRHDAFREGEARNLPLEGARRTSTLERVLRVETRFVCCLAVVIPPFRVDSLRESLSRTLFAGGH